MKKKGFTLVELLAVIVILAVIALIATPMILNVIEGSKKGALKDSAYGLMESADIYYTEHTIDGINKKTEFTFEEGMQTSVEQLGYKGRIEKGSLNLYSDGKVALCITDGKYAAIKNVNEEEVRISSGRCSYNETTEEYETVGICSDLESELEKVKEENNKKIEEIRNEYEERISNLTNDYEEQKRTIENTYRDQIEELNRRIEELENNKQLEIEQIRADYEAQVKTQQEAYEAQINELSRQLNTFKTGGTASASDIVSGKTAFVKGSLITGSMANRGGQTVTSNTVTQSGENALITVPENGYYNTSSQISVPIETIQNQVDVGGNNNQLVISVPTSAGFPSSTNLSRIRFSQIEITKDILEGWMNAGYETMTLHAVATINYGSCGGGTTNVYLPDGTVDSKTSTSYPSFASHIVDKTYNLKTLSELKNISSIYITTNITVYDGGYGYSPSITLTLS